MSANLVRPVGPCVPKIGVIMTIAQDETGLLLAELMLKAHLAKRDIPKIGDEEHPTEWDLDHRRIDELLTKWERVNAVG